MTIKARLLLVGAVLVGFAALVQLLFVVTKLPNLFWSDLMGGLAAAAITAVLMLLLRAERRRERTGNRY